MDYKQKNTYQPYREYVKHETMGQAVGKAAAGAVFSTICELLKGWAKSKTKF